MNEIKNAFLIFFPLERNNIGKLKQIWTRGVFRRAHVTHRFVACILCCFASCWCFKVSFFVIVWEQNKDLIHQFISFINFKIKKMKQLNPCLMLALGDQYFAQLCQRKRFCMCIKSYDLMMCQVVDEIALKISLSQFAIYGKDEQSSVQCFSIHMSSPLWINSFLDFTANAVFASICQVILSGMVSNSGWWLVRKQIMCGRYSHS